MERFSIALVQQDSPVGRREANLAATVDWVRKAAAKGASLVMLPELGITGHAGDAAMVSEAEAVPDGSSVRALCDVAAHALAFEATAKEAHVRRIAGSGDTWEVVAGQERAPVAAPRARSPEGAAPSLGADTAAVLAEMGIPC